ncbi:MAG: GHKL domain-containing protein [Lachnospira sp.]|nr:GHKL domain-containing protein [Lachnospira sp.]
MLIQILSLIHNVTTIVFGIFLSAFFLGVKQNSRNSLILLGVSAFEGFLYIASAFLFGEDITRWCYALIIHFPLIAFLLLYYKYSFVSCCISVFSAYLCCQLSNWVGLLMLAITNAQWCYYISRILITVITFFLLCRFVCHTTETIFTRNTKELYIIGFLPTVYYISDYTFTKLSNLLYSSNKLIVEFMGFVLCISYFAFLILYFHEYEKKQEIRQYNELMKMQLSSIEREIKQVKQNKQTLTILRHDMRHHLDIILTQLQMNNRDKAISYIKEISNTYDDTVITTYCQNEMVNSVVSIYQTRFAENGIMFHCDIAVNKSLPCPDTAICTILSNALENSMHALEQMDTEEINAEKWVRFTISQKGNHLLLHIENPVYKIPKFVDGIPTSDKKGHGIGVKSIVYYVEQLNGQCHFSVSNHLFVLRIII